jgi:hypothetical protein
LTVVAPAIDFTGGEIGLPAYVVVDPQALHVAAPSLGLALWAISQLRALFER